MSQRDWAKGEIEIAMKRENPEYTPKEERSKVAAFFRRLLRLKEPFDYGCGCYESAYKAFLSLCEDGHSGMSFGFTKAILIKLMDGRPLTPIEDSPDEWGDGNFSDYNEVTTYQCKRMNSLFKEIDSDGAVTYSDMNRSVCYYVDDENGFGYQNGICSDLVDELYPIELPYSGIDNRYKVYCKDYEKGNDFYLKHVLYIITPDKKEIRIDKYYGVVNDRMVEICKDDFLSVIEKYGFEEYVEEQEIHKTIREGFTSLMKAYARMEGLKNMYLRSVELDIDGFKYVITDIDEKFDIYKKNKYGSNYTYTIEYTVGKVKQLGD